MPRIHPDELTLQSLVDSLRLAGLERALTHLTSCQDCQTRARALAGEEVGRARSVGRVLLWPVLPDYAPALGRGSRDLLQRAAAFEHERADAAVRWSDLERLAPEAVEAALEEDSRCRSWGFVEALLDGSRERTARDPAEAERLARLAHAQVVRLDAGFYGSARLADLAARCLGQIAHARREGRDLAGAVRAFADAEAMLRSGTRDPLERAELWTLRAALHRTEGRIEQAEHLLQRAFDIFRTAAEAHRAGRCLVALADLARQAGDAKRATERLRDALPMLDSAFEPELALIAQHNLISFLAEGGLYLAARRLLAESRAIYRRFPAPRVQWRRSWVEGRIAAGLGQLASAERALRIACEGLGREGLGRDAAQAALELADVLLRQQRSREAGEIAEAADARLRESETADGDRAQAATPEFPFPGPGRSELAVG
ncbi:MAG TPA: tetratricopeptide repeat protein [Thermoanaerobaculia bacterium]|jgi:tetratricopeptide (TPR) repeat protein|nr:tetratricopeptide repeat protein [Thermoanaerobaculia bacterium]